MQEITTSINIDASPDRVWAVLTDNKELRRWSSFVRSIDGKFNEGERLIVVLTPKGERQFILRPRVLVAVPGRELRWLGHFGIRGLFDGEHRFVLSQLGIGQTRLEHAERFKGILLPFLTSMLNDTAIAFERFNRELRQAAEAQ